MEFEVHPDERPEASGAFEKLRLRVSEYGRLLVELMKLYVQSRVLMAQNFILTCKLQMWELTFLYARSQIFLVRLAHGFPLSQCWPER
jgi:hypothetical protein